MAHRTHEYKGQELIVRYDAARCIHAAECVARLDAVFDTSRRRWVEPDNAPPSEVAAAVIHYPTGALHYSLSDGNTAVVAAEPIPVHNTITQVADGPLYVRGNIEIVGSDGAVLLTDTRVALCRCGMSKDKPYCDNSHIGAHFTAPGTWREHAPEPVTQSDPGYVPAGKLIISIEADGPYCVQGEVAIYGTNDHLTEQTGETWLCRCGASDDKPFCDSSHRMIEFSAE